MNIQQALTTINRNWNDMMEEESNRIKHMTEEEWLEYVQQELRHPVIRVSVLENVLQQEQQRKKHKEFVSWVTRFNKSPTSSTPRENFQFLLWKDMVSESAKYGRDMESFKELEEDVNKSFWGPEVLNHYKKQELMEKIRKLVRRFKTEYDRKRNAAIRIQALYRGHSCRNSIRCRFRDCCHCLAHTTCTLQVGWRYWVCKDCVREIVGQVE